MAILVRAIAGHELAWFGSLSAESAPDVEAQVQSLWDQGTSGPNRTLVAESEGRPIGRVALYAEPLGCGIEEVECRLAALWLDWRASEHEAAAARLFETVADLAAAMAPTVIERRLNPELHEDIDAWRQILEANGYTLFQEKQGYVWMDVGSELPSGRLMLEPLSSVGPDAFADAMARATVGTLDRNDHYYIGRCSPAGWSREMLGYLEPGDESSWLIARTPQGELVGYVALGGFEPNVATIVHIGVVPEQRGRGFSGDLLDAAGRAARERGFTSILSDVDTQNAPMAAAMERAGHIPGRRPWHVWAYRRRVV